jgi:alpha-beta hydrolase superfamily lysophospholipase
MNAHQRAESDCTPTCGLAQALYFYSAGKTLFGWLHRPTRGPVADLGLVICKPFGYEATCSHRSVRAFAEAAADLGVPTLRFDYLGTGDSADIEPQADQLEVWSRDVLAAISELQRSTGVRRVCLLGIRLGALLATLASRQCRAVDSVILIGPIVSGPRHLRELRTTRLAASLKAGPTTPSGNPSVDTRVANSASLDVSGFPMSAATVAALSQIDLASLTTPPARQTLIIDGDSQPSGRAWAESLSASAGGTKYLALPGLIEMVMRSPLRAAVPLAMVAAMRDWLHQLLTVSSPPPAASAAAWPYTAAVNSTTTVLTLPGGGDAQHSSITERPVFIASRAMLFGIVTEPRRGERRRRGVVLLNTGADYHIGANGMHVSLARRWARHGYVVLRLDLGGLGDSGTGVDCPDDDVFPPTAVEEIQNAIDFLRSRYGVAHMTIGGVCSGAYHALRAAAAKLPINQILMINPQNYFWKKGMRIDELQLAEVVRNPTVYLHHVFSLRAWKKLLTGEVSILKVVNVYVTRSLLAIESTFRELARRMRFRLPRDLGSELEEIGARGIRMVFVFARGEPGLGLLKLQGGSSIRRLADRCRIHIISDGDHIFSQRDHRKVMEDLLTNELFARNQPKIVGDIQGLIRQS